MIRNYLTVALRVLVRQRQYASINITGLALGIACCLLMAILVTHEWSYDRFHERRDRIFRLVSEQVRPSGNLGRSTLFPPEVPRALVDEVTGIELAAGYSRAAGLLAVGNRSFRATLALAGPAFLRMFSFPLLAGDPATALAQPDAMVITQSLADKLFSDVDGDYEGLLGQPIADMDLGLDFVVAGVAADIPDVSSIEFEALASIRLRDRYGGNNRGSASITVYLQLAEDQAADRLEKALSRLMPPELENHVTALRSWQSLAEGDAAFSLRLQPLTDVYGNTNIASSYEKQGNRTGTQILAAIAAVVLLLACSNFATLSTALSTQRAREVGMRKVLGAARTQVMRQFWGEALLIGAISLVIAVALTDLALPWFSSLVQIDLESVQGRISSGGFGNGAVALVVAGAVAAVVVMLSGSYVALVLARLSPVAAMRGGGRVGGGGELMRALVVMQYAVSIGLLIHTSVMLHQLKFARSKNLGYDQEHVVVVRTSGVSIAKRYKDALVNEPRVAGVTVTDRAFTTGMSSRTMELPGGEKIDARFICIDPDFLPTLSISLAHGRNFSHGRPADKSGAVLINESLAQRLGAAHSVGSPLPGFDWYGLESPTIVGIVRDFHIDRLQREIQPLVLQMHAFFSSPSVMIKLTPGDLPAALKRLESIWASVAPETDPIRLSFLDANLENQYRGERRWQRVLAYASAMAIVISCMGLFGLASLSVARRMREIAIRKTVGASVRGLVRLMSRQFVSMLVAANAVAWPVAFVLTSRWLESFVYRVDASPGVFVGCGAAVVALALATTGVHTIVAALRNPADILRHE